MLKHVIGMLGLITCISVSHASTPSERQHEVFLNIHKEGKPYDTVSSGYLIYYPEDYETDTDKEFPVVLFLHGAGEKGQYPSALKNKDTFLPGLVEADWNYSFIIISPLARWSMDSLSQPPYLEQIMNDVRAKNRIDTTREYVAGLSQGGKGARLYAERNTDKIAGLISAAGYSGGNNIQGLVDNNIPVILSHNKNDNTISFNSSDSYYKKLIAANATDVIFDIEDTGGHNSWGRVFTNMDYWDWLLTFSNQGNGIIITDAVASPSELTSDDLNITVSVNVTDNNGDNIGIDTVNIDFSPLGGATIAMENLGNGNFISTFDFTESLLTGEHNLLITAVDLDNNSKIYKLPVNVIFPPNDTPTINIISPLGGEHFTEGDTVTFSIQAQDTDGSVENVQLYANDTLVGSDNMAPYEINSTNLAVGINHVIAIVTDNLGLTASSSAITVVIDSLNPSTPGIETLLSIAGAGKVVGGNYFPLEYAFDAQPSYLDQDVPEIIDGGNSAPYYSGRAGYIDFGEQWYNVRITKAWTLYSAWSNGTQTPYSEVWWDNDIDAINDSRLTEYNLNFNSAVNLSTQSAKQWHLDGDFQDNPITPQAQYLILQAPIDMTNRAIEYALVGWIQTEEETPVVEKVITPYATGNADGGNYFPMEFAFDTNPSFEDGIFSDESGGEIAPYYSGRYGYIDFGPNWADIKITQTHTLYRPWSGGDHTPYAELWWDDEIDTINDGVLETQINFNSASGLAAKNKTQWVQDTDFSDVPVSPKSRYLLLKAPETMTNRALEYAIIGY